MEASLKPSKRSLLGDIINRIIIILNFHCTFTFHLKNSLVPLNIKRRGSDLDSEEELIWAFKNNFFFNSFPNSFYDNNKSRKKTSVSKEENKIFRNNNKKNNTMNRAL